MAGHEVCQPHSGGQVGRRSKLTDEVGREILDTLRLGTHLTTAARGAGVSEKTVYEWLREGRKPGAPSHLARFAVEYERAEAEGEKRLVGLVLRQAVGGDGRLALEMLARRYPERWAKNRPLAGEEPPAESKTRLDLSRPSSEQLAFLETLHADPTEES